VLERLKEIGGSLLERLRALSPARLFVLLGLVGAGVAIGVVSLLWMSREAEQSVLYAHLTMDDAAAMASKLKEMGVPYRLEGDGTTILVPASMVHDMRLRLATEGLPRGGGAGFELFDQRNFGMTEFMQKLNYRRALQGELARTISQLDAVHSARVHIVLPEKSLFLEQQDKPTASVVLKLAPGRRLTPEQIRGIAHLVASSVEGLSAEAVTLVDHNGEQLRQEVQDPARLSLSEEQQAYQRTLERTLERRAQGLLARAIGQDKVLVRVSAELDFQRIERAEERYDADNPAVRSEQRSKEVGSGPGFWAIGVPGVRSNVTSGAEVEQQGTNTASRESETINYEVSKVVSKIVAPSGEIKRLSVAVLVDGAYQPGAQPGETTYVPRTEEELAKFRDMVKSAVGYNEARGDRVEIANIPFEVQADPEEAAMAAEARRAFWLQIGRYGAYVILGLLCLLFVVRPLLAWLMTASGTSETMLPRTVQELEADMAAGEMLSEAGGVMGQLSERSEAVKPTGQQLRVQLAEFVTSEPERAAELLRAWLRG
jgi:flagellar M-ring protein FliF